VEALTHFLLKVLLTPKVNKATYVVNWAGLLSQSRFILSVWLLVACSSFQYSSAQWKNAYWACERLWRWCPDCWRWFWWYFCRRERRPLV